MRSSKVLRALGPVVGGTAAFLLGYELLGVNCSYAFFAPACSNALGWSFPLTSDYRPTWFAAVLLAVATWWVVRIAVGNSRPGVRPWLAGASIVCLALPLGVMRVWPGLGALAVALSVAVAAAPFGLGLALGRRLDTERWKEVATGAVLATGGMGFLATEGVAWGTHSIWGAVHTAHLWIPAPFALPGILASIAFLRWGRAVATHAPEEGGPEGAGGAGHADAVGVASSSS